MSKLFLILNNFSSLISSYPASRISGEWNRISGRIKKAGYPVQPYTILQWRIQGQKGYAFSHHNFLGNVPIPPPLNKTFGQKIRGKWEDGEQN